MAYWEVPFDYSSGRGEHSPDTEFVVRADSPTEALKISRKSSVRKRLQKESGESLVFYPSLVRELPEDEWWWTFEGSIPGTKKALETFGYFATTGTLNRMSFPLDPRYRKTKKELERALPGVSEETLDGLLVKTSIGSEGLYLDDYA